MRRFAATVSIAILLAGCATPHAQPTSVQTTATPPAAQIAGVIHVFHGVKIRPNTTNIDWSNASFAVSPALAPTLSFFRTQQDSPNTFACWLDVSVDVPNLPPAIGSAGTIVIPVVPNVANNPGPWLITFDNAPAGHWSIAKITIGGTVIAPISGNVAGTIAGKIFQAMAVQNTLAIVDGTVQNCAA